MLICSYVIFLLRDKGIIERLREAMGEALVSHNFSTISTKISFHMTKKMTRQSRHATRSWPKIFKALKNIFDFRTESVSQEWLHVFSSEPVTASSDCSRLGNVLCLCLPVQQAQAVLERGPKSWPLILQSKPLIVF